MQPGENQSIGVAPQVVPNGNNTTNQTTIVPGVSNETQTNVSKNFNAQKTVAHLNHFSNKTQRVKV